jgi:nitroreductase
MLEVIRKRRSVRSYLDRPVEKEKIGEILRAAMFAPSANHRRPWEFVVVKDKETKNKLSSATPWASFAAEAPLIIVVCADESISREWLEDASIVGAHIYLETTNQGLGTCWIQVRDSTTPDGRNSEEYVRELLRIPDNFRVVALFPVGYPAEKLPPHSDQEFEQTKIHSDSW